MRCYRREEYDELLSLIENRIEGFSKMGGLETENVMGVWWERLGGKAFTPMGCSFFFPLGAGLKWYGGGTDTGMNESLILNVTHLL